MGYSSVSSSSRTRTGSSERSHRSHSHRHRSYSPRSSRSRSSSRSGRHYRRSRSGSRSKSHSKHITKEEQKPVPGNTLSLLMKQVEENPELYKSSDIQFVEKYKYGKDLYIGGIPEGTNSEDLLHFFNKVIKLAHLNIIPGDPCLTCRINTKFAFINCRSEEEVNKALNLDQIPYMGHKLKIGRPSTYEGPTGVHGNYPDNFSHIVVPEMSEDYTTDYKDLENVLPPIPTELISLYSTETDVIIYTPYMKIDNILSLEDIEDDDEYEDTKTDIQEQLQNWGTLQSLTIPRDGPYKGFVFAVYEDEKQCEKACTELKKLLFDGKYVKASPISKQEYEKYISTEQA
ncbi:hypothetical protein WA158_000123 [Blastocystis sp. Blastoise]